MIATDSTYAPARTLPPMPPEHVIFGQSAAMAHVREIVDPIAMVNIPVLIVGPTGTGKEVLASYIHQRSPWSNGPFIKMSCAAFPASLLEAELFGFEKSAFTGAIARKPGLVELAEGGTLLLDNVADLDPALQPKLLRFLQNGSFSRIGETGERTVHTRLICTANRRLSPEIDCGSFRDDLFHRIAGAVISMPNLRERVEDIPIIAEYLLGHFAAQFQMRVPPLSNSLLRRLRRHSWTGNLWELESVLRRYTILGPANAGTETFVRRSYNLSNVALSIRSDAPLKIRTQRIVQEAETQLILQVLQDHDWNRTKSAEYLNISLRALLYKMRVAGISGHRTVRRQR